MFCRCWVLWMLAASLAGASPERGEEAGSAGQEPVRRVRRRRLVSVSPVRSWSKDLSEATSRQLPVDWTPATIRLPAGSSRVAYADTEDVAAVVALPFFVVPVSADKKNTQGRIVSKDYISTNNLDRGGAKTRNTNLGGSRTLRPGLQPLELQQTGVPRPKTQPAPRTAVQQAGVSQAGVLQSGVQATDGRPASASQCAVHYRLRRKANDMAYTRISPSSMLLLQWFNKQKPTAPELPPAVIPDYGDAQRVPGYEAAEKLLPSSNDSPKEASSQTPQQVAQPQPSGTAQPLSPWQRTQTKAQPQPAWQTPLTPQKTAQTPPRPRFERSFSMRGRLTVPRADYTEPYRVWWNATTGAARVDLHGGATSAYRLILTNSLMQNVEVKIDRVSEPEKVMCAMTTPRLPQPSDRAPPGLPNTELFSFAGYQGSGPTPAERWTYTLVGEPGQYGGAPGEALVFYHELLVARPSENEMVIPLNNESGIADGACEETTITEQTETVDPLKEFTLPYRDPRYDNVLEQYIKDNLRQYEDDAEVAVRKNIIVQTSRRVNSGNRQGATFRVGLNLFGDRLKEELRALFGVRSTEADEAQEKEEEAAGATDGTVRRGRQAVPGRRLPARFDWRDLGGVTHVRFQGAECSSCWAFAVTGAVEGALFAKTGALVAMSEQAFVDCAHPYGANGCKGTWPAHAYDYAVDRGVRVLDEYPSYKEKVMQCVDRKVEPVTNIQGHVNVTKFQVRALKQAISEHSPTVVVIDAMCDSFVTYTKGVIEDNRWHKKRGLNHAVLAVGFDESRREPHFITKNSWSDKWGDGGYARLHGPSNACGVLTWPSYPVLEEEDVNWQLLPKNLTPPR
ncbi:hypothetical protein K1T71_013770 [Dendrolimus kikuchii]|uniref:Uncharacterized protein n=1 Tax=Dendrolimus kikuchii TaxID=765133 RepID=A0ACC1CFP5_9NEOP|nr:hypothetical protein K1T71_013770 [Dendrolimus kikuchii]